MTLPCILRAARCYLLGAVAILLPPALASAQQGSFDALARASLATIDGELWLRGLRDTVRVLRDPWGVPHVYAKNIDDLFFAQGFVQAQDRLWQMEMYRRTYEGRLAEILGPSAVRHDRLARLLRYRGPWDDREFGSYHAEGRRILQAFVNGVNAFIALAGDKLPVEFRLTGIRPEPWTPDIPLLRTQTAMPTGDARSELTLARSVAQYGAAEANRRARPDPFRELVVPRGVDLSMIDDDVLNGLAGPLLSQYQAWVDALPAGALGVQEHTPGSNNWVVSGRLTASGKVIVANDPHRNVGNPSIRYIVHLVAPGWDVIGATEPALPGVAIGHNGRIAWGLTIVGTDQSDVFVEEVNPANRNEVRWQGRWEPIRVVRDTIQVQGAVAVVVEHKYSRHGPIFFEDTVRHRAYAMRSTMHEPGTAGYLGALRYHALTDCRAFLDAQVYYKAPTENMICGDATGNIAWQASALSPKRSGWDGRLPVPGTGEYEWAGFRDDLPREFNPARGWIATANHNIHPPGYEPPLFFKTGNAYPRFERLADVLSGGGRFTVSDFQRLQHDSYSASAARDVALFQGWTAVDPQVESARAMLAGWDATYRRESAAAALYSFVSRALPADARRDETSAAQRRAALERALVQGLDSLRATQGDDPAQWRWGRINMSQLAHSLVRAYDIPAIERTGGAGTVAAIGATYRQIIDFADLDGSVATNVPGQSGQPGSAFYANLAQSFADRQYFPLLYTRAAVESRAAHRLVLVPPAK
jgi:penicillin amidase